MQPKTSRTPTVLEYLSFEAEGTQQPLGAAALEEEEEVGHDLEYDHENEYEYEYDEGGSAMAAYATPNRTPRRFRSSTNRSKRNGNANGNRNNANGNSGIPRGTAPASAQHRSHSQHHSQYHSQHDSNSNSHAQHPRHHRHPPMQGVLWKRRDIFKNRWRPRWFVLHPRQRMLTYYILSNPEVTPQQLVLSSDNGSVQSGTPSVSTTATPRRGRRGTATRTGTPATSMSMSLSTALSPPSTIRNGSNSISNSNNLNSNSNNNNDNDSNNNYNTSNTSSRTIHCDVVPRGTIFLPGSTVEANEALTRPKEVLYAFTIADHEKGTHFHLATRDPESREEWIRRIRRVSNSDHGGDNDPQHDGDDYDHDYYYDEDPMLCESIGARIRPTRLLASPPATSVRNPSESSKQGAIADAADNAVTDSLSGTNGTLQESSSFVGDPNNNNNNINNTNNNINNNDNSKDANEILVLMGPLVLYKILCMASCFKLAALAFAIAAAMAGRKILIDRWLSTIGGVVAVVGRSGGSSRSSGTNNCSENDAERSAWPIGGGTVCCRFRVDLHRNDGDAAATLAPVVVKSLAKAIREQPFLVSTQPFLLPRIYSTDIEVVDLTTADPATTTKAKEKTKTAAKATRPMRVSGADQKSLSEIEPFFRSHPPPTPTSPTNYILQRLVGTPCRIVLTRDAKASEPNHHTASERDPDQNPITVDLNLTECPATVLVSLGATKTGIIRSDVSVHVQSTDVEACRKFAQTIRESVLELRH